MQPRVLLVVETEIWPNLLAACDRRGVPVVVVNGRLSPGKESLYRRLGTFYRQVLDPVRLFLMQEEGDARRLNSMGVVGPRVRVVGDLKADQTCQAARTVNIQQVAADLGIRRGPVWVAGSTHPGEDVMVARVYTQLKQVVPELQLILAPRHLGDVPALMRNLEGMGVPARLRSEGKKGTSSSILVLDTLGELASAYSLAQVTFVGGTLVPIGGHSVFEPAAFARPIILGPHDENFLEESQALLAAGAAVTVSTEAELYEVVLNWIMNPDAAKAAGKKGLRVLEGMAGATQQVLDAIAPILNERQISDPAAVVELQSPSNL